MNMMQLPQNYRPVCSPFQHAQQADDTLNLMLKQTDKSPLIAKLNSGFFSQTTLHSLLYKAFSEENPDVVVMMLKTKNYGSDVLANIIVDTLNNELEKNEQSVNNQERFVSALLKDASFKIKLLTAALHIAARKGINLNNDRPLSERLIKLAALSADEAAQIANACSDICEFSLFEPLDRENSDSLSNNLIALNETEVTKEVSRKKMELAGYHHLKKLPHLYTLNLSATNVTDNGFAPPEKINLSLHS